MIHWLAEKRIAAFERDYDYDMSYVRQLLHADFSALRAFQRATSLSRFRGALPVDIWHLARVVAGRNADCGPCLQLVVTMAERSDLAPQLLRAGVTGNYEGLSERHATAARFMDAVMRRDEAIDELRPAVIAEFGEAGVVALGLCAVAAQAYPTIKFALGFHQACQRVQIAAQWVAPNAPAAANAAEI